MQLHIRLVLLFSIMSGNLQSAQICGVTVTPSGFGLSVRKRRSPTPNELRAQALHALSTRITSLYWFNLSLKSLLKFPDTWEPITRIGREIQMLSPYYLSGDAFQFERTRNAGGQLDWGCASIVGEECASLFANDLAYVPDPDDNTFRFGEPRAFSHLYPLPHWLHGPTDVFRVDADGVHEVQWAVEANGVRHGQIKGTLTGIDRRLTK